MVEPPLRHVHNNTYMSVAEQKTHYITTCEGCGCPIKLVQPWYKEMLLSLMIEPSGSDLWRAHQKCDTCPHLEVFESHDG